LELRNDSPNFVVDLAVLVLCIRQLWVGISNNDRLSLLSFFHLGLPYFFRGKFQEVTSSCAPSFLSVSYQFINRRGT